MDDLVYICFCFFITQWPLSSVPKVAFVVERWPLWRGRGAVQQPFVFGVRLTFSCQKNAYFSIYKSNVPVKLRLHINSGDHATTRSTDQVW